MLIYFDGAEIKDTTTTKWIQGRCTKMKKMTCSSARDFVCRRCTDVGDGTEEPVEVLCDEVKTVKGFCYLGDTLNASGECETAVTSRVRIGWMKFRECGELLGEIKVFFEDEKDGLSKLCKIGNVVWK